MIFQVKGKLFEFNPTTKDWIEKGTGVVKLNIDTKNKKYRMRRLFLFNSEISHNFLVMRMDTVQKLILNSSIFAGMVCEIAQSNNLRFSAYSLEAKIQTFLLRVSINFSARTFVPYFILLDKNSRRSRITSYTSKTRIRCSQGCHRDRLLKST